MSATARPGPRLAGTDVIKQLPGGAVADPENARLADKAPCPFMNSFGDILKWKKKRDVDTKGARKIRVSSIQFLTKPDSMPRLLATTAGLGCILNRIDL
jgi:hypothetical protein